MPHASCYSLSSSGVRLDYNVALGLALALNSCLDNWVFGIFTFSSKSLIPGACTTAAAAMLPDVCQFVKENQ